MDGLPENNEQLDKVQPNFKQAIEDIRSKIAIQLSSIKNHGTADEIEKITAEIFTLVQAIKTLLSAQEDLSVALRRVEDSLHRPGNDSSYLPTQAREVFKQAMRRASMQQQQIARNLGIKPSAFSLFLSGKRNIEKCHAAIKTLLGEELFLRLQELSVDESAEKITIEIANVLAEKFNSSAESTRNADESQA